MDSLKQQNPQCNTELADFSTERRAEKYNYRPPSAAAVKRLELFWTKYNRHGQNPDADRIEPRSQTETVWAILCQHQGAQVQQFKLQHPEGVGIGKGWIALLNPRIHELKNRFGYQIQNRTERIGGEVKSWYWIVLGPDGQPRRDHPTACTFSPNGEKAGTFTPTGANVESSQPDILHAKQPEQQGMFTTFLSYETGARR